MAWLNSLLKKPGAEEPALEPELVSEPEAPPEPTGPRLAVLVPDQTGISSFRITQLPDAAAAAEHVGALRTEIRQETHAFWALHDKPIVDEGTHVEAMVLIRAQAESDLVYVVSFLDIESAFSFTRFEVRRGLHLGNVMIYWAAFAQMREEIEGISITPAFAPPTENYVPPRPTFEEIREPEIAASVAVAEPEVAPEPVIEPEPEPIVEQAIEDEADTREAVEEYLRQAERPKRRIIEPAPEPAAAMEAPVIEEQLIAEPLAEEPIMAEPVAEGEFSLTDEDLGPMWPGASREAATTEPEAEAEISSPVAEEQHAIKEAFVFQHKTVAFRPAHKPTKMENAGIENGMVIADKPEPIATFGTDQAAIERLAAKYGIYPEPRVEEQAAGAAIGEPEPGVETFAGDEEMEFTPLNNADPASGLAAAPKLDDFDVAYEVERLLRGRKWEQRNGPFSGFESPPGRF